MINNVDPEQRGRLHGERAGRAWSVRPHWAEPCVPLAGPTGPPMGVYLVPPIGAGVWVEFEQGDPNYPDLGRLPLGTRRRHSAAGHGPACRCPPQHHRCQTARQNMIMISDLPPTPRPGGIMLKSTTGACSIVNDSGIYIAERQGCDDHDDRTDGHRSSTAAPVVH